MVIETWGIPFLAIGLHFMFGRFLIDAKQRANTGYGVTDRRVCAENNRDPARYQEYLKNPSLFMRSPEQAASSRSSYQPVVALRARANEEALLASTWGRRLHL